MEKATKNIHRGKVLHEAAKAHPGSIKEIVEAAGYQYGTFFKHIKAANLSFRIIAKYGKVMHKDFSIEFPEMSNLPFFIVPLDNKKEPSDEQTRAALHDCQEKYNKLLEKHTTILEELLLSKEENRSVNQKERK